MFHRVIIFKNIFFRFPLKKLETRILFSKKLSWRACAVRQQETKQDKGKLGVAKRQQNSHGPRENQKGGGSSLSKMSSYNDDDEEEVIDGCPNQCYYNGNENTLISATVSKTKIMAMTLRCSSHCCRERSLVIRSGW